MKKMSKEINFEILAVAFVLILLFLLGIIAFII